jgi:DNA-binding CsgD family transcriptional regulator
VNTQANGVVLFGDVVNSRVSAQASAAWLETLCGQLDRDYGDQRLADFEFTQGDEIQGLLDPSADPVHAVLQATLRAHAGEDAVPPMRWVAVYGAVEPGRGPATRRTGPAFFRARSLLEDARRQRDGLRCETMDARADALLDRTAPALAAMINGMTDRQRVVARMAIVDGLRQSEIADSLGIARATVSVASGRADVRNVGRLADAVRLIWREGITAPSSGATVTGRELATAAATGSAA